MIEDTLNTINKWYNEPTEGNDRPKLLSKLAVIELCGWLEGEFDRITREVNKGSLNDIDWTEKIISNTNGFHYDNHFRPMIVKILGEHLTRTFEAKMESDHPGELDHFKSMLGGLWKQRCNFAHAHIAANVASQQNFMAPSWAQNQLRIIKKTIRKIEDSLLHTLSTI